MRERPKGHLTQRRPLVVRGNDDRDAGVGACRFPPSVAARCCSRRGASDLGRPYGTHSIAPLTDMTWPDT